jgi:hypothetical protein
VTEYLVHDQLLLLTALGTVTGLRAGQPRYRGSIRGRDRRFLTSQTGSVTNQPPVQWVNGNGKGHPKQATKGQRGNRGIALLFLLPRRYIGWVVNATPRPLYPREGHSAHCMGGLEGPQGRSGRVRKISPSPEFDSRTGQPAAVAIQTVLSQSPNHWAPGAIPPGSQESGCGAEHTSMYCRG